MSTIIKKSIGRLVATKTKDLGNGVVEVVVSTNRKDRHGEKLDISGLNIDDYSGVVMLNHNYSDLPIGKSLGLTKTSDGKLVSKTQFAINEYPVAETVYKLVKGGFMPDVSIGFVPEEWDAASGTWIKSSMVEYSHVGIGANPDAKVINSKALQEIGLSKQEFETQIKEHSIKMKQLHTADDIKTKGPVADELLEGDKSEMMEDFWEVVYAFADAYYDYTVDVDQFTTLLQECVNILQTIVDGNYSYEDEDEDGETMSILAQGLKAKKSTDKIKALVKAVEAIRQPNAVDKIDKKPNAVDNVLKYLELAKQAISDTEEQLKTPIDTEQDKTQTIHKKLVLRSTHKKLNSIDRIVELATAEVKKGIRDHK